jgi:hypothetical protein
VLQGVHRPATAIQAARRVRTCVFARLWTVCVLHTHAMTAVWRLIPVLTWVVLCDTSAAAPHPPRLIVPDWDDDTFVLNGSACVAAPSGSSGLPNARWTFYAVPQGQPPANVRENSAVWLLIHKELSLDSRRMPVHGTLWAWHCRSLNVMTLFNVMTLWLHITVACVRFHAYMTRA